MSARYTPNSRGTREFMNSQMVGTAMRGVADQLAGQANTAGRSRYEVRELTVAGGWGNTSRAGAEVYESRRDYRDVRDRVLVNVSRQFYMRAGGGGG